VPEICNSRNFSPVSRTISDDKEFSVLEQVGYILEKVTHSNPAISIAIAPVYATCDMHTATAGSALQRKCCRRMDRWLGLLREMK
jgi:hypothetical protein